MSRVPKYRKHARGYAFVQHKSISNKDHRLYLGKHNSPESIEKYTAFIEALNCGEPGDGPPIAFNKTDVVTVTKIAAAYLRHAKRYYRRDGGLSDEYHNMRYAIRALKRYGRTDAKKFGPKRLKSVRSMLIREDYARKHINHTISRIKRMFRWACEEEILPAHHYSKLLCVKGLYRGEENCRENDRVRPAPIAAIFELAKHLPPTVAAMLELQFYCGMRPGEVCIVRACDIDTSGDIWLYRPQRHKNAWRGFEQVKAIPKIGQEVIKRFMVDNADAYLFSPADSAAWCAEQRRLNRRERKTTVYPCELRRVHKTSRARARRTTTQRPGECYGAKAYRRALMYGFVRAEKAGAKIRPFTPHQVRHSISTFISQQFGEQAAQRYLGHENLETTSIYTEKQISELITVATQVNAPLVKLAG